MSGHDWELKGGASVQNSRPTIPQGVALWQCRVCGLAAPTALTAKNEALNAVVREPEVGESCEVDA